MTTFCYSDNEERFDNEVEADSMEEARTMAEAELGLAPGTIFYIGVKSPVDAEMHVDGDDIVDRMSERMYEDVGEVADGWPDVSQEQLACLTGRIRDVVRTWIRETNNAPTFYAVLSVESYAVRKPAEQKGDPT